MADSGHWEVVRKKSKPNANNNNNAKNEALVYLEKMPRAVDDYGFVGKESLFGILAADGSYSKQKTQTNRSDVDASQKQKNETVVTKKPKKKPQVEVKVKLPKTIDEALKRVNADELRSIINMVRMRFVHSSNIWLSELVVFFHSKMDVDTPDPLFASKDSTYPLSAASKEVRRIVADTIAGCDVSVLQAFLEKTLTDMALQMSKGVRVNGHRLVLQAMIRHKPSLVLDNLVMFGNLRNTYQNRQNICESFLWVASVAGTKNFDIGLKVWLELLLPVIGMTAYSKFVVDYICSLFRWHSKERTGGDAIEAQRFFPVFDIVFNNKAKLSSSLLKNLLEIYPKFKKVAFGGSPESNLRNFFPSFLSRLTPSCSELLKNELLTCLLYCLRTDTKCYIAWLQLYTRHLVQSSLLLEHLIVKWEAVGPTLPLLKETLGQFNEANTRLSNDLDNGVVKGLPQCRQHCQKVLGKMSTVSKSIRSTSDSEGRREGEKGSGGGGGFFAFRPFVFVLFVVLASALFYDCQLHGSFKDSRTGRLLNDYGFVHAYDETSLRVKDFYGASHTWVTANVPIYVGTVKQFCQPYTKLFLEWVAITKRFFFEGLVTVHVYLTTNIPLILQWVDERFPGVVDTAATYIEAAWTLSFKLSSALMTSILYYGQIVVLWLQENVFTGELAVDKLQKHVYFAVSTIQTYMIDAFDWVGQQLKTNSK